MKNFIEHIVKILTAIMAISLAACGGGGGGGSPVSGGGNTCANGATNYPTCTLPVPKPAFTSFVFTQIPTLIDKDAAFPMTANYTGNVTSLKSSVVAKCNNADVPASIAAWSTTSTSATSSMTTTTSYGANCTAEVTLIASGPDGDSLPSKASISWKVKDAPITTWWPPKTSIPMGTRVDGTEFKQLPAGCTSVNMQCWKDFVTNGQAVFVQTSAKMDGSGAGVENRPIIFGVILRPDGKTNIMTFFADTGELMNPSAEITQSWSPELSYVIGNDKGYIIKEKNSGACYQWRWNGPASTNGSVNVWDYAVVSCPF
ncbi:hypothetical protein [Undibacterium fentianense]|uniref:Uncharacterized protein n=1 Tax=Undibacterium fentianense TaxID=2828728 RepID=A0A941E3U6_9BURK|nr:hypothetical protein [Undibacterium fentianense]MBR7799228.1 hypothetical protein [Undibacterium fentianense]